MRRDIKNYSCIFILLLSLLTVIILAFLPSCQPKAEKEKTIKLGLSWDLTGPVSEGGGEYLKGFQEYIKYFEEQGAIKEAKLELIWADSGYAIPRVLSNYTRFKEAGVVIIQAQASQEAYILKPIAERDRIPILNGTVDAANYFPPGWIFTAGGVSTADYFAVFLKWLQQNWKEPREPKIAIIGWDNTLGRAPLAVRKYTDEVGAKIVAQEFVPVPSVDYSGSLLRIKEKSPDYVFVGIASGGFGPFLKDAERTGVRGKVPIVTNGVAPLEQALGPAGALAEGLVTFNTRVSYHENNIPGIKEMQERHQKVTGKPVETDMFTWGWIDAKAMLEFVRQAANEVGADNITGQDVKNAIEKTKSLNMSGLTKPLSYGPEKRRGNDYARFVQIKGKRSIALTDWIEVPVVKAE